MTKFGFAKIDKIDLLSNVFHIMTGFVKEIHGGANEQFKRKVPVLSFKSLKALVFCIRNCFEADVMQGQKAYPEALSD